MEYDPSYNIKFHQLGLGLINYCIKCVEGNFIGKSINISHAIDGQIIGAFEGNKVRGEEDEEEKAV